MGVIRPISSKSRLAPMPTESAERQLSLFEDLELLGEGRYASIHTTPDPQSIDIRVTNGPVQRGHPPFSGGVFCKHAVEEPIMTVRNPLTTGQRDLLEWMLHNDYSYRAMARRFDISSDTLKRILIREGLAEFDGAKYAIVSQEIENLDLWERPCIKCKSSDPRPRWQYVCDNCKPTESIGLPDDWIAD
jgi:hypothetical protein